MSELLLAVVFEPDEAGGVVAAPVVEHADEHNIVVAVAIEVGDRCRMGASEMTDPLDLEGPLAGVFEPEAAVVGLRVGVGVLEIVTDGDQQVGVAVLIEVGGDESRATDVEVQPLVESSFLEASVSEVFEGPDFFVVLSDVGDDVEIAVVVEVGDGDVDGAGCKE